MADPEHLAALKKGVEAWNQWRASHIVKPDLSRANLSNADLSEANLERANLVGVNLRGAKLDDANLARADLSEANLLRANLLRANLSEAIFSGAQLKRANLVRANLVRANLVRANLERADLERANLSFANLNLSNLSDARAVRADLSFANLSEANLERANLSEANLSEANLSEANLSEANLSEANLVHADLSEANLSEANLSEANLSEADLIKANLRGACLAWTDLRETNLREASLVAAHLSEVDLSGANLSDATCGGGSWGKVRLLQTIGLSTLIHRGLSTLGTNFLALSEGRLPVEFLKGCGLADWEIESAKLYDPDLTTAQITDIQYRIYDLLARGPIQISPVFISYSHGDTDFVDSLGNMLDEKGVRYWRDIKDATAGRLDKVIERGISLNPTLLLVLSEHAIESDWVEYEVDKAVQLSKQLKRDVLCPIALDKAWLESDRMSGNLRTQIMKYNVLDFGSHNDTKTFETQFRKLIDGLGLHYRDLKGHAMGTSKQT